MDLDRIIEAESNPTSDLRSLRRLQLTLMCYQEQLPELKRLRELIQDLPTPGRKNLSTEALLAILALLSQYQSESEVYRKLYRAIKEELFHRSERFLQSNSEDTYLSEEYVTDVMSARQNPLLNRWRKWFS